MAAGAVIKLIEIAQEVGKTVSNKGLEGLKEGKSFKEALKGGFESGKETAFKEFDKLLSLESQQKLIESSEKLNDIQDKIENDTPIVEANLAEEVKGLNEVTENVNEVAKDLELNSKEASFLSEIKGGLQEFKEVLDQIQEVQKKLIELGISPDLLHMLSEEATEIEEMEDIEEEGTE